MSNISELIEDELVNNYEKYYRLVYSYTKNEADALDAIQEGACKSLTKASTVKSPEFISTWIYKIMINEALSILRKRKKETAIEPGIEEGRFDSYTDIDLQNAIEQLELTDQTIIKLRYFEDIPIKDIAKIVELNENTVKSRLYRALEKLKLKMEEK